MACRRSRRDFVFVGVTKIFGPAYTMRTRTMRMSRMIPMIIPAPKPPSPVVPPPGVLTLVCPMSASSPFRMADALRGHSVRSEQETSRQRAKKTRRTGAGSEGSGELRGREKVGRLLPPLVDERTACLAEQCRQRIRGLAGGRRDDDDVALSEGLPVAGTHVPGHAVHDLVEDTREAALVLAGVPGALAGDALRARGVAGDDRDLLGPYVRVGEDLERPLRRGIVGESGRGDHAAGDVGQVRGDGHYARQSTTGMRISSGVIPPCAPRWSTTCPSTRTTVDARSSDSIARTSPTRARTSAGSPRPKRPSAIASSRSNRKNVPG